MTATDAQVRIIMRERNKGRTQEQAAASANLRSRKTVAKYERLEQLPSALHKPRQYRTRQNAFAQDWAQVTEMLEAAPSLEAKALFEWLCEQYPGRYQRGQLRTFQRHVARWRALNEPQVALLEQTHAPGVVLETDGTWLTELGVTLHGEAFKHLLIHSVLPYSNWEWGRVAQSESLAALRLGLQSTLLKLGHVPQYHRTDNSSAATYWLRDTAGQAPQREYTDGYLQLLAHYGLEPQTTHIASPHENGDVEASNHGFKQALEQYLLLRGSRDFAHLTAYEEFLFTVFARRNRSRTVRLAEEIAAMQPLRATPLATHRQVRVRVTRGSLIRVQKNVYSVPTSLIGRQVTVYVHEWQLEVYYQTHLVATLPRLHGAQQHHINYRHVIDSLLRKPGGFRDYRYREDLFPSLVFRRAWEQLQQRQAPRKADLTYLRILHLAARQLESAVAAALEHLLTAAQPWDDTDVERLVQPEPPPVPQLTCGAVQLQQYDQLLAEVGHDA
jgi:hypothetical protein